MTTKQIVERLGGEKAFGREVKTEIDLADAITEGLSAETVDFVLDTRDLSANESYSMVGSRRTLTRKRRSRAKLSPGESERLARAPYNALDGEGARLLRGPWTSEGTAVVREELTLLLKPAHRDAERLPVDGTRPFAYDPRPLR